MAGAGTACTGNIDANAGGGTEAVDASQEEPEPTPDAEVVPEPDAAPQAFFVFDEVTLKGSSYPFATQMPQGTDGGSMVGGPSRAIFHTTETKNFAGGPYYHLEVKDHGGGNIEIRQYRPLNRASRALRNENGGVQTNRQGDYCLNVAITDYAAQSANWSPELKRELAKIVAWSNLSWGVAPGYTTRGTKDDACYGTGSPCRMNSNEWLALNTWAGHANVPENDHWDPGLAPIDEIMSLAQEVIDASAPNLPAGALNFQFKPSPETWKSVADTPNTLTPGHD